MNNSSRSHTPEASGYLLASAFSFTNSHFHFSTSAGLCQSVLILLLRERTPLVQQFAQVAGFVLEPDLQRGEQFVLRHEIALQRENA